MSIEATKHKERLKILERHLGDNFYKIGELHNAISDAMAEASAQSQQLSWVSVKDKDIEKIIDVCRSWDRTRESMVDYIKSKLQSVPTQYAQKSSGELIREDLTSQYSHTPTEYAERSDRACPCLYLDEPCDDRCTCRNGFSSSGCRYCCTYGSEEQRKSRAIELKKRYDIYPEQEAEIQRLKEENAVLRKFAG